MAEGYRVALDALDAYARAARRVGDGLAQTRSRLVACGVTADSFGLLGESGDLHSQYEQRCTDGLAVLQGAGETYTDLGDAVADVRRAYEQAEGSSDGGVRQVGGHL